MSIQHYRIFREVAFTNNFTEAANRLYLTQSAVSYAIKALEDKGQIKLFERHHKSVSLTSAGFDLLKHVNRVLESYDQLDDQLLKLDVSAPIRVVSCITYAELYLSKVIHHFNELFPNIVVYVEVVRAEQAIERLKRKEVDLAIIEGSDCEIDALSFSCRPYVISAFESFDYGCSAKTLKELTNSRLLLREKGSAVRDRFDAFLELKGLKVNPLWSSVDSTTLIEAAINGLGVVILPEVLVIQPLKDKKLRKLEIDEFNLTNQVEIKVTETTFQRQPIQVLCELLKTH